MHSGLLNFDALAFYESWHDSILDQQRIGCLPAGEKAGRAGGVAGAPIRPPNWACDPPRAVPNLTLAQYQFGPVSDVVPREQLGMGYMIGDPSWEVAATAVPYELLTQLGDAARVAATFDEGPAALLAFFNALGEADAASAGLIPWSYLGDWVAIDTPNRLLVANVNYVQAALQTAEMAAAAGRPANATAYLALAALLSDAMRARFWNASAAHWDAGSQSAQALCLAAGVGGAAVAAPAAAALLGALAAAGGHVTVGASGARVLLTALHDAAARPDVALALALQAAPPGWGAMLTDANASVGTFWESWREADVAGGSSLNHIFKAGGISPYLVESALGLRFAMRPPAPADAGAPCPAADACAGALPADPRARFGLDCAHAGALCAVIAAQRGVRGGTALAALRSAVEARVMPQQSAAAALQARVGLTVGAAAAAALGSARGWRATPAGNVSFAWEAPRGGALRVALVAPAAAATLLELPLPARARVTLDGGAARFDVAGGALAGGAAAWAPRVHACAGAAAAFVEGQQPPARAEGCQPVLVLSVPTGEHTVLLEAGGV